MIVPASRFSTLPEGCPVWRGETFGYWHTTKPTRQGELGWMDLTTTEPVDHEDLTVDLSTPAAVRAFAPELICAVRGLAHPLEYPPAALWAARAGHWVLVERIGLDGTLTVCRAATGVVTGPTPAACLLAGLQAALDAVGGAQ